MSEFTLSSDHHLHLKNVLALDYGEKFIGVAIFCVNRDPYPIPFGRIANKSSSFVIQELKRIIDEELIDLLIVGLPHLTDGQKTSTTAKAQNFINFLLDHFNLPIETQDETLSTFEAKERMKTSPRYDFQVNLKEIDALAASIILEDFIRRHKHSLGL